MSCAVFENSRKVGDRITCIVSKFLQTYRFFYVLLHIFQGSIDDAMYLVIILFLSLMEFPVLWHIAQRTEIEMQER